MPDHEHEAIHEGDDESPSDTSQRHTISSEIDVSKADEVQERAEVLQTLVNEALRGELDEVMLQSQLAELHTSPEEAQDILDQIVQQRQSNTEQEIISFGRETSDTERNDDQRLRDQADAIAWAVFQGKLDAARKLSVNPGSSNLDALRSLLSLPSSSLSNTGAIPPAVLSGAPFLAKQSKPPADKHIAETLRLRHLYRTEKAADSIIDSLQQHSSLYSSTPLLTNRFLVQSGRMSSQTNILILKFFMDHWSSAMTMKMNQKRFTMIMSWLRRRIVRRRSLFGVKPIGSAYMVLGKAQSNLSICIGTRSFMSIAESSLKSFVPVPMNLTSRSPLIRWFDSFTLMLHSILTIVRNLKYHFCPIFGRLPFQSARSTIRPLFHDLANALSSLAKTGTLGSASLLVSGSGDMTLAPNVEPHIELKTPPIALLPSLTGVEKDELVEASERVSKATEGPRRLAEKRKADESFELPRYRRGYGWANSDKSFISPAAFSSETAPPLPMPPERLINNPEIHTALDFYANDIKVETPFNLPVLERYLENHPNRPLVDSVLWGLRYGFWPLDEGDWNFDEDGIMDNYPADETDMDVIKQFRDKEITAGRWSNPIPTLLPGMKISPMFVNWRDPAKPRIITDHTASGLNDGIPKPEAKVRYDDMHDFGQTLHDIYQQFPDIPFILYKSDVSSAFLNLPAHPIWQLRQIVVVDKNMHIVRRLVFGNRASPRIWCALSGLLCWIAIHHLQISGIFVYMDNFYGWEFANDLVFFHNQLRPRRQVTLLKFWDEISCPYEDKKQLHGSELKIIGF
ncbi:unnamed protein product [Somion occarium]|uniref:Reverse transcriptase n=1 Tax=Somion occarium TaxID=3059160 RepID=A0ABP1DMI7_9APHY